MDWTQYLPPAWAVWTFGTLVTLAVASVPAAIFYGARKARARDVSKTKASPIEDWLTRSVATIATGVSAEGMWRFTRDVLLLEGPLQIALFAFIELSMVTEAVRARRNMREHGSAGLDGIAVWALACLTAVLSSMDARQPAEAVFRLASPLVAAWMWERGMRLERRRLRGTTRVHWRITPERVLVWLRLADARDRTASEVDAVRRLKKVALAAKNVHQLHEAGGGDPKSVGKAVAKRDAMLNRAVLHTDLATNPRTQAMLLDLTTTLGGGEDLTDLLAAAQAPWRQLDHPAITGQKRLSEAARLAVETQKLSESVLQGRDPDSAATIKMLASMLMGQRIPPPGSATSGQVSPTVADLVAGRVSLRAVPSPLNGTANATPDDTSAATGDPVADEVADLDAEEVLRQLREEPDDDSDDTATATASATETMWRYWQSAIAKNEVPTGADLAREGGCVESYGRRKRNEWLAQLDGHTRRRLLGSTRRERSA